MESHWATVFVATVAFQKPRGSHSGESHKGQTMHQSNTAAQKFTDPAGACVRLSISRPTLYRLIANDPSFPPKLKIGRVTRFEVAALDRWMLAQATAS